MPEPRRTLAVTLAVAVGLAGLWWAAPAMGTDLSAQVARADFFAAYGWAVIDFRWYGGVSPLSYSLISPPVMALLGPWLTGALAAVVSALALVLLLLRTGAPRPLLGGVLGAACFTGNLVSGRITFALGVAIGLLALVALVALSRAPGRIPAPRQVASAQGSPASGRTARAAWFGAAGLLAALAAATSPVAGLFVGLAGVALVLGGSGLPTIRGPFLERPPSFGERGRPAASGGPLSPKEGRGWVPAVVLALGAGLPVGLMAVLFGTGGWMNMSRADLLGAVGASLLVAALVPHRVVRVGALLSALGVVVAFLVPTPVGLNATRLATLFALPLVAAFGVMPRWLPRMVARPVVWLAPVLVALAVWQPPVILRDLTGAGHPTADPEFFAPLADELARRQPAGRVEVVPTEFYWESAQVATVPLARGWLRQADLRWNPLFFDGTLAAGSYRQWLADTGVSHVALAHTTVSWVGRREAQLVEEGLPYLTVVWENEHWTLYEVAGAPGIVDGPAELREAAPDRLVVVATGPGEVLVRVRWSRWLTVSGPGEACLAPAGHWTVLQVDGSGSYRLTSSSTAPGPRC